MPGGCVRWKRSSGRLTPHLVPRCSSSSPRVQVYSRPMYSSAILLVVGAFLLSVSSVSSQQFGFPRRLQRGPWEGDRLPMGPPRPRGQEAAFGPAPMMIPRPGFQNEQFAPSPGGMGMNGAGFAEADGLQPDNAGLLMEETGSASTASPEPSVDAPSDATTGSTTASSIDSTLGTVQPQPTMMLVIPALNISGSSFDSVSPDGTNGSTTGSESTTSGTSCHTQAVTTTCIAFLSSMLLVLAATTQ